MLWELSAGQLSLLLWLCWGSYGLYSFAIRTYRDIKNNLRLMSEAIKTHNQNPKQINIENKSSYTGWALLAELFPSYIQMLLNLCLNSSDISPLLDSVNKYLFKYNVSESDNDLNNDKNYKNKYDRFKPFKVNQTRKPNVEDFMVNKTANSFGQMKFNPNSKHVPNFELHTSNDCSFCDLDNYHDHKKKYTNIDDSVKITRNNICSKVNKNNNINCFKNKKIDEQYESELITTLDSESDDDLDDNSSKKASICEFPNNEINITSIAI